VEVGVWRDVEVVGVVRLRDMQIRCGYRADAVQRREHLARCRYEVAAIETLLSGEVLISTVLGENHIGLRLAALALDLQTMLDDLVDHAGDECDSVYEALDLMCRIQHMETLCAVYFGPVRNQLKMGNRHALPEDVAGMAGDWCSCSKQACEDANPPSMRPQIHNEADLRGDPSELPHSDPGHRHLLGAAAHTKDPTPAAPSATYVPSQVGPISRLQPQIAGHWARPAARLSNFVTPMLRSCLQAQPRPLSCPDKSALNMQRALKVCSCVPLLCFLSCMRHMPRNYTHAPLDLIISAARVLQ